MKAKTIDFLFLNNNHIQGIPLLTKVGLSDTSQSLAQFLLAFGIALGPQAGVHALAGDTDGVDGMADVAGAMWRPDTLLRAAAAPLATHSLQGCNAGCGPAATLSAARRPLFGCQRVSSAAPDQAGSRPSQEL